MADTTTTTTGESEEPQRLALIIQELFDLGMELKGGWFIRLPDPDSPRERYRRETIARAIERANEHEQVRRRDE